MEDLIEKKLITDLKILIINIKNYKIIIFLSQQKKNYQAPQMCTVRPRRVTFNYFLKDHTHIYLLLEIKEFN